jgi:hypothetical protein
MLRFENGRRYPSIGFRKLAGHACNKKRSIFVNDSLSLPGQLVVSANLQQNWRKSRTMLLASVVILLTVRARRHRDPSGNMIQSNSSYRDYGVCAGVQFGRDRLPMGPALLVVFGLSLLGWAVVLAPLVAILR